VFHRALKLLKTPPEKQLSADERRFTPRKAKDFILFGVNQKKHLKHGATEQQSKNKEDSS